jgi:hypothetical protein
LFFSEAYIDHNLFTTKRKDSLLSPRRESSSVPYNNRENSLYIPTLISYLPSWALMAHSCNPSYAGGRDQEDGGLQKIVAETLSPIIEFKKRAGRLTQVEMCLYCNHDGWSYI